MRMLIWEKKIPFSALFIVQHIHWFSRWLEAVYNELEHIDGMSRPAQHATKWVNLMRAAPPEKDSEREKDWENFKIVLLSASQHWIQWIRNMWRNRNTHLIWMLLSITTRHMPQPPIFSFVAPHTFIRMPKSFLAANDLPPLYTSQVVTVQLRCCCTRWGLLCIKIHFVITIIRWHTASGNADWEVWVIRLFFFRLFVVCLSHTRPQHPNVV